MIKKIQTKNTMNMVTGPNQISNLESKLAKSQTLVNKYVKQKL